VFTTLLQDWLGSNDYVLQQALFDDYLKMPLLDPAFVASSDCYYGGTVTVTDGGFERPQPLTVFPNPARISAEVTFNATTSFAARLTLHNLGGQVVYAGNVQVQAGDNLFYLDVAQVPVGSYVVRLENRTSGLANVAKLMVVK
jgi:hypothetical protein